MQSSAILTPPRTLADTLIYPSFSPAILDSLRILVGVLLVTLLAQVAIPLTFTPVPLTGQTLGVLLCGMLLGARRGFISQWAYLSAGAFGLPVFAGGGSGIVHLTGPTAGYLWAFPLIACLTGYLAERGWDRRPLTAALAMSIGSILLLMIGSLVLSIFVGGLANGFFKGMVPFLPGEALKVVVTCGILPGLWRLNRSLPGS